MNGCGWRERSGDCRWRPSRGTAGCPRTNLVLIEQDAFEELPTGLYGRAAVRIVRRSGRLSARRRDGRGLRTAARARRPDRRPGPRARVDRAAVAAPVRSDIHVPSRPCGSALPRARRSRRPRRSDPARHRLRAHRADGARRGRRAWPTSCAIALPSMVLLFALIAGVYFVLLGGVRKRHGWLTHRPHVGDPAMVGGIGRMRALQRSLKSERVRRLK